MAEAIEDLAFVAGNPEVIAGHAALGNRVRWVHASDNTDVARFFAGGELLLTTGQGWPDDDAALAGLVGAALLLVASRSRDHAPPAWGAAAFGVAALAHVALTVIAVLGDPAPKIDVWVTLQQGSDVLLTMVDGKVLYDRGEYKTLDIERVIFNADRAAKSVLTRLS